MDTIKDIFENFVNELNKNRKILSDSIELHDTNNKIYSRDLHFRIVESCFLEMFNFFEDFIEQAFILYLLGEADLKGNIYECCTAPKDKEHAYNLLRGRSSYPKWTDVQEICCLANLYFKDFGPFKIFCSNPIQLNDIKLIRNYLSHKSLSAKDKYKNVLQRNMQLSTIMPAEFLLSYNKKEKEMFFSYYENFLKYLAETIVTSNEMY